MSAPILQMPSIPLDRTGYPAQHAKGEAIAAKMLRDMMNQVLEDGSWLNQTDAEWITTTMLHAYLVTVRGVIK